MITEYKKELVEISLQIALTIHGNEDIKNLSTEELTTWFRRQYQLCGYNVQACGSSWASLFNGKPEVVEITKDKNINGK